MIMAATNTLAQEKLPERARPTPYDAASTGIL